MSVSRPLPHDAARLHVTGAARYVDEYLGCIMSSYAPCLLSTLHRAGFISSTLLLAVVAEAAVLVCLCGYYG